MALPEGNRCSRVIRGRWRVLGTIAASRTKGRIIVALKTNLYSQLTGMILPESCGFLSCDIHRLIKKFHVGLLSPSCKKKRDSPE